MLRWWTIGRATGVGVIAACSTLILWPLYGAYREYLIWPLLLAVGVAGFSGVSILAITTVDLLFHRRRSERLRPLRVFDLIVAFLLIALTLLQLETLSGQLPA
jgi:hypothetical protein